MPPADGITDWLSPVDSGLEAYTGIPIPDSFTTGFIPKQTLDNRGTDLVFATIPFPVLPQYGTELAAIKDLPMRLNQ